MRCNVRSGSTSFNSAMFCYLRRTRGLNNITACWKPQPWVSTLAWYLFKRFHVKFLAYIVTVIKLSVALLLPKYWVSKVASQSLWTSMFVPAFFFVVVGSSVWQSDCIADALASPTFVLLCRPFSVQLSSVFH